MRGLGPSPVYSRRCGEKIGNGSYLDEDGKRRKLGSRISEAAGRGGGNFVTPEIAHLARRGTAYREIGALIDEERLATNLLLEGYLVVAFYRLSTDSIHLPPRDAFIGTETSTPAESFFPRCVMSFATGPAMRAAAIGSWASASATGPMRSRSWSPNSEPPSSAPIFRITDDPRADHAQYFASWLAVLKADTKAIFTAASKASEAAAFLAALQPHPPAIQE